MTSVQKLEEQKLELRRELVLRVSFFQDSPESQVWDQDWSGNRIWGLQGALVTPSSVSLPRAMGSQGRFSAEKKGLHTDQKVSAYETRGVFL